MSNLKTYCNDVVRIVKNTPAYAKTAPVLAKALYHRFTGEGVFEVTFIKVGKKWYCDVPGFPKELFEHTLMVGGASKFLDYYSRGESRIVATIKIANEMDDRHFCGSRLYKTESTLTGGAFYKDPSGNFNEEIWLCPVTLFLLGKYPERILIYKINKNYLHCPIFIE
jgi:hypothetical protein